MPVNDADAPQCELTCGAAGNTVSPFDARSANPEDFLRFTGVPCTCAPFRCLRRTTSTRFPVQHISSSMPSSVLMSISLENSSVNYFLALSRGTSSDVIYHWHRSTDGAGTLVMGAPACLAVSAATRLASLLRSRLSSSSFCSLDSASSGASVQGHHMQCIKHRSETPCCHSTPNSNGKPDHLL